MNHVKFTKKELRDFLRICSSIDSNGNIHPRAILDNSGKPIPAQEYVKLTGGAKLVEKFDFSKTPDEKRTLALHKSSYKEGMRKLYGDNWRKVSKKLGYFNVPTSRDNYKNIEQEITNLKLS